MSQRARSPKNQWSTFLLPAAAAAILALLFFRPAMGQSPLHVVAVEEEWELVVGTPDADSVAPQVTCAISPSGGIDGLHATFEVNSQSLASYSAGGLQLQVWNGETALAANRHPEHNVLAVHGERITWTSKIEVSDGQLTFSIRDGHSNTWGQFGGQGYLRHTLDTSLTDLNGYQVATSVENSGVGYAANRVQSLTLKRLRVTLDSGEVLEDATPRVVHSSDQ